MVYNMKFHGCCDPLREHELSVALAGVLSQGHVKRKGKVVAVKGSKWSIANGDEGDEQNSFT